MKITLNHLTEQLRTILKSNAPVRGEPAGVKVPPSYLRPTKLSPFPGNLKLNGIVVQESSAESRVLVGGAAAPYASFTEDRSFKKGWMAKSRQEFADLCRRYGGKVR